MSNETNVKFLEISMQNKFRHMLLKKKIEFEERKREKERPQIKLSTYINEIDAI